jgi:hypothetical protein
MNIEAIKIINKKRKLNALEDETEYYISKLNEGIVTLYYYKGNVLHRNDGPAIDGANKIYYQNGAVHRTDGPAVVYANGLESWYYQNQVHRSDGPAVEHKGSDGSESFVDYYLFGYRLQPKVYYNIIKRINQVQTRYRKRYYKRYNNIINTKLTEDVSNYIFIKYLLNI